MAETDRGREGQSSEGSRARQTNRKAVADVISKVPKSKHFTPVQIIALAGLAGTCRVERARVP